jgi:undecaprenyl-diphosphatase
MDQKLLFLINYEWTSPALDSFMAKFTCFAAWMPLVVLLVAWAAARGGFRGRAMLLVFVLVLAMNDGVVSQLLKNMVNRPRPNQVQIVHVVQLRETLPQFLDGFIRRIPLRSVHHLLRTTVSQFFAVFKPVRIAISIPEQGEIKGVSFPSAHTVNTFSAATVLTFFYRRRGALCFIPAALVGYSRIYLGAHWPSDVLVSIFIAVGVTLLELALLEWAWRKFGARFAPQIHARHPSLAEGAPA